MESDRIDRFLIAQNHDYLKALQEVKAGRKLGHWMWYIFPQLGGLGKSEVSRYYALDSLSAAAQHLNHPVLGRHLIEISNALLSIDGRSAYEIFGTPDDIKLRSCMTLFAEVKDSDPVFRSVLRKYFEDLPDELTLEILAIR